MEHKPLTVHACANGVLVRAVYQNGSIILFDNSGLALGHIDAVPVVHIEPKQLEVDYGKVH